MTDILITVMNAPKAFQRALSLVILFCFTALVLVAVGWLLEQVGSQLNAIRSTREELYRLEQLIARKPPKEPPSRLTWNETFIEGDTLSSMQAKLQERINTIAVSSEATISSVSGMPHIELDGVRYIGVRASIEASIRSFHDLVRQVEVSVPPLIIRQASLRNVSRISAGKLQDEIRLVGQIVVYGAANPSVKLQDAVRR